MKGQEVELGQVELRERARLLTIATVVCALHAPVDLLLSEPESWPVLVAHRLMWVASFVIGVLVTRRGGRLAVWAATALGIVSALFTTPLVEHSGLAQSPIIVWFVTYPALAATIVPTDLRAVAATASASLACLLWVAFMQPGAGIVTICLAAALVSGLSVAGAHRHVRTLAKQQEFAELAARASELAATNEARAAAAEQVLETHRLATVGTVTAGVAHDLRNYAQSLEFALAVADEEPEALADARDAARAIQGLCHDVLSSLSPSPTFGTPLGPSVQSAMRLARAQIMRSRVECELDDVMIMGNSGRLVQILVNLLANAAESGGEGGTIRLTARQAGASAVVCVDDDGPGIPPHLRERVFEAFYTTKGEAGTGLGLHMCQRYVHQLGGELTVTDSPLGGARFILSLPLAEPLAAMR
jgi:signal transduction histidine kinase